VVVRAPVLLGMGLSRWCGFKKKSISVLSFLFVCFFSVCETLLSYSLQLRELTACLGFFSFPEEMGDLDDLGPAGVPV